MKILKSQLFRQLTVLVILVGILVSSIVCTQASIYQVSGLFGSSARTNVFKSKTDNAGSVGDVTQYPIKISSDDIGPEFDQLGFDILLGTERDMLSYTGEIPRQWKDKEGLTLVPYSNYGAVSYEYWGIPSGDGTNNSIKNWNVDEGQELAKVEEWAGEKDGDSGTSEVTSIRMYALTKSSSFSIVDNGVSKIYYKIWQKLCGIAAGILKIFISVKNISIAKVLEEIHLDKLVKLFTKVLVKNNGQLSVFMIVAIISFIFAIVGYAINFVRGNKKSSLKDILILAFCGFTVVGMCTSGNPTSLGTNAANGINKLTTELVYDSVAGGKDLWQSKAKGKSNDSTEISYNETTLINKTLIEIQILNQFGVNDISDLSTKKFGNVNSIGFTKLDNTPEEQNLDNFGNNLGYYYWFANSPSPDYNGNLTNTFRSGEYKSSKVDVRLEGLMSYLQKAYNTASKSGDTKTKARILSIVDAFAKPHTGNGAMVYFLLTIEYVMLCLLLARLVLRILLGKLLISGSVLGLPIAGPLLLTTRKKCVDAAKLILMVLVTYSIQVFILSVLFDLILNVIGVLITPKIWSIALAMAVTVGLHAFLPTLYRKLDKLFATINSAIGAGQITQYQNRAAQAMSSRFNGLKGKTVRKTVTQYDADGNAVPVAVEQSTGMAKAAAITAAIAGYGDGNRGSNFRNIKKIGEQKQNDKTRRAEGLADTMHSRTEDAFNRAQALKEAKLASIYGMDIDGGVSKNRTFNSINVSALSEADQAQYSILRSEYDSVLGNNRYQELKTKQAKLGPNEQLSSSEQAELNGFIGQERSIISEQSKFNNKIQQQVNDEVRNKYGDQITNAVSSEVRTADKAVEDARGNAKVFKFKSRVDENTRKSKKELGNIIDKSMDSADKELQFFDKNGEVSGERRKGNHLEIEKNRAKTAKGVSDLKETLKAVETRNEQTTTIKDTAHHEQVQNIQDQLTSRRKKPFGKK